jgi:serpin B
MNLLLILSLFASPLRGTESKASGVSLVPAKNRFGFKLFCALVEAGIKHNLLISPFSITTALSMTNNGAAGETRAAMARCLEIEGVNLDELNEEEKSLAAGLQNSDARVQLLIANSLWARKGVAFKSGFLKRVKQFYQAEATVLDFASRDAPDKINGWVRQKTRGRIDRIVNQITPEVVLFLINAVYFKGKWQEEFDPKLTAESDFHLIEGTTERVLMMSRSGRFDYLLGEGFQAVALPYGEGRFSMVVLLPDESLGLNGLILKLNNENWQRWQAGLVSRQGEVKLPRFKMEYEQSLKEVLKRLDMAVAFDLERADFSEMSSQSGIAIGDVKHKSFIEVNEEGTEAAAVTSVEMVMSALPVDRFRMVVDHPFIFAIQDNATGAIIFLGAVVKP